MGCCDSKYDSFVKSSLIQAGQSIIRHYIDPKYNAFVDDDTKAARLKKCESCENLGEFFGKKQCKICLCFVEAKASLIDQKCPHLTENKWNF